MGFPSTAAWRRVLPAMFVRSDERGEATPGRRAAASLGTLLVGLIVALLCAPSSGCNPCGTSCMEGVSCVGQPVDRCTQILGCKLSDASCICTAAQGCSTELDDACGTHDEAGCASAAGCGWLPRCFRPRACDSIIDDENACSASGCYAHAECD